MRRSVSQKTFSKVHRKIPYLGATIYIQVKTFESRCRHIFAFKLLGNRTTTKITEILKEWRIKEHYRMVLYLHNQQRAHEGFLFQGCFIGHSKNVLGQLTLKQLTKNRAL